MHLLNILNSYNLLISYIEWRDRMDIYSQPLVELKEYTDIIDGLKLKETPIDFWY